MQAQNQLANAKVRRGRIYHNTWHCAAKIYAEDGLWAGLWRPGLVASVGRDVINGGLRVGAYPYMLNTLSEYDPQNATPGARFAAGCLTGAFGSALANPFDLVKIRFQTEAGTLAPAREFAQALPTAYASSSTAAA